VPLALQDGLACGERGIQSILVQARRVRALISPKAPSLYV
jgi:hypothetical protein